MTTRVEIPTSEGVFTASFSATGLRQLEFPTGHGGIRAATSTNPLSAEHRHWLGQTTAALTAVLRGESPVILPPLDWSGHTDFRQRVWREMLRIPRGHTLTYGEIADALGQPSAARAVGGACGANPVPVLVPCHRVLAAGGAIGGFSGGLDWKRRLLAKEGITPKEKAPELNPALL